MIKLEELAKLAKVKSAENKAFFRKLEKMDTRRLDGYFHNLHEEVFDEIDCLECGNCCRSLGPRISDVDVARVSNALKVKPAKLMETYLRKDEDGDLVFRNMPCPFLQDDNYCSIYPDRPKACREYPHTDRRRIYQILPLTLKNTHTCPAVFEITERLKLLVNK
ncbi:MAG: YkgJ family cysteine cluster protein [Bacteroidales bacterium]|nr:YkgJ family cysteine cluster protein [Bacteroidales bacterium]